MFSTKDGRKILIEQLTFDDVVNIIESINPKLTNLLDKLSCGVDYPFYKASYHFGDKIIHKGQCFLSLEDGSSIDFNNALLPDSLLQNLGYNLQTEDPLGLILNKKSEFYLPTDDRIVPYAITKPGQIFGIPRAIADMEETFPTRTALNWSLNAGARSLFILSPISARDKYVKLQSKYGAALPIPTSPQEHWLTFKEIAKKANCDWRCDVIYFSRQWINLLKLPENSELANFLIKHHRSSYNIFHNISQIWTTVFNDIEKSKHLTHYSNYALSTARQLFFIAANSALAFKPATTDESAPIKLLQKIYGLEYGLITDNQSTVIMEPSDIKSSMPEVVYYSLHHPTLAENNPQTFKGRTLTKLLDEVKHITEIYRNTILFTKEEVQTIYDVTKSTEFAYYHYHYNSQTAEDLSDESIITNTDSRFTDDQQTAFPKKSTFFLGCIKIRRK